MCRTCPFYRISCNHSVSCNTTRLFSYDATLGRIASVLNLEDVFNVEVTSFVRVYTTQLLEFRQFSPTTIKMSSLLRPSLTMLISRVYKI